MRLRIPSALPYFFGGLRISSGLALIGAVVAEFVAGTGGTSAGPGLPDPAGRLPAQHPAPVRGAVPDHADRRPLFVLMAWLTKLALGSWHASELSHD